MLVFSKAKKTSSKNHSFWITGRLRIWAALPWLGRRMRSWEPFQMPQRRAEVGRWRPLVRLVPCQCHLLNGWVPSDSSTFYMGFRKERILLWHELAVEFISGMFCSPGISWKRFHHGHPHWRRWKGWICFDFSQVAQITALGYLCLHLPLDLKPDSET